MATNYQGGNDAVITGAFTPLMQTLQRNYLFEQEQRNQQARQAAELQKQIQKDLSQVNANGLRQADLPAFTKEYSGVKEKYYQFLNARTPEERSTYAMQINEGLSNLNTLVGTSKEYGKIYSNSLSGLSSLVGKGKVDEARKRILDLGSKPSSELTIEAFDTSDLLYTYDPTKVDSAVTKLGNSLLSSTTPTSEIVGSYQTTGGRNYNTVRQTQSVSDETIFERVSELTKRDRNVQGYVEDIMTERGIDFNTAVAQVSEEFRDRFTKVGTRDVTADRPAPRTTVINLGNNEQEIQRTVVPEFDIALRPNGTRVKLSNYIPLDQPQSIGGVIRGHDPLTNQQEVLQGNHRAKVLGAGTNSSGAELLLIAVPDPNYPDEERVLTVNKDTYLNRVSLSKREADYIKVWEERFGRGVQNQAQNTPVQNRNNQSNSVSSQSTTKPKLNW